MAWPSAAYWLLRTLGHVIPKPQPLAKGGFSAIRLLLEIEVRVGEIASRVRLAFASNCPDAEVFRNPAGALGMRPT
jgi:hypothetical protein